MKLVLGLLLLSLSACALSRVEDDVTRREQQKTEASRPKATYAVLTAYCQWLEKCNASEFRRDECWMRNPKDACEPELARMCQGEIDLMPCNDRLSVRCEPCFADDDLPP